MAQFRFRAAAALDLRVKTEERAKRTLGDTQAALDRAKRALGEMRAALDATLADGASAVHDPGLSLWYRNWITRQRQELTRRRAMVADRHAAVDAAMSRVRAAHRDVRVLERLRDRLHSEWALAERRKEQKELDWLGSVRYAFAADPHEEIK
jgi:flagellar export protein FliJ